MKEVEETCIERVTKRQNSHFNGYSRKRMTHYNIRNRKRRKNNEYDLPSATTLTFNIFSL